MTKPKSEPRRSARGRPPYPALELYVRFEATRRLANRSINAHAKGFEIGWITNHSQNEPGQIVTGEALRRHIQVFRREELVNMTPAMLAALERTITAEMALLAPR